MKIKEIVAAVGIAATGVAFAIATQGSAQAVPAHPTLAMKAPTGTQADWKPPVGYVLERSFMGDDASCRKEGDRGVSGAKWRRYVCHEKMVQVADVWTLMQSLYVKK
ncbi:hypothetical protein AB0I10_25525 [Streptomyces sp. NPDC050636]|uniref:hypothetical protein n=1 Tax=Streptomyces sp. NPDC050636 TaxID=3154510 RepID=UPI0034433900